MSVTAPILAFIAVAAKLRIPVVDPREARLAELEAENARLKAERDAVKKAAIALHKSYCELALEHVNLGKRYVETGERLAKYEGRPRSCVCVPARANVLRLFH